MYKCTCYKCTKVIQKLCIKTFELFDVLKNEK